MSHSFASESLIASRHNFLLYAMLGLAPFFVGCRTTSDNQIDLLERELRVQEDYIYELEDYVVEYSEKLRSCRSCPPSQMAGYSEEIYESAPAYKSPTKKSKTRRRAQKKKVAQESTQETTQETNDDDLPTPSENLRVPEISPEELEVPDEFDIELGDPVSELQNPQPLPQVAATDLDYGPTDDGRLTIPDPVDFESAAEGDLEEGDLESDQQFVEDLFADEQVEETVAFVVRVAERLEVTQLFQGEGDELSPQSLLTVVEALDANGEPVDLDGEISLMVMTAGEDAALTRLKRWNFTAEETMAAWQSTDLGDGLHLELPLEKTSLPAAPLELWVRLVTADGRKLLTQLPFEPDQLSDVASVAPLPLPTGLSLAETENQAEPYPSVASLNSLRIETERIPPNKKLKLVENEEPANSSSIQQPQWRASMHRTDRPTKGFASSAKVSSWTTQSPGRQTQAAPAKIALRPLPTRPQVPTKPVWTSGRKVPPYGTH